MDDQLVNDLDKKVRQALRDYLTSEGAIAEMLPACPDVEDRFPDIFDAYVPDGAREFVKYPVASLAWMMYIGMAVAQMWDEDWDMYSRFKDIYRDILLKGRGYDEMDEYIAQEILRVPSEDEDRLFRIVNHCASLAYNLLMRQGFEPSTVEAFHGYARCCAQLYYFGMAMQLHTLGYKMTPIDEA